MVVSSKNQFRLKGSEKISKFIVCGKELNYTFEPFCSKRCEQIRVLELMKFYPEGKSVKEYSRMLCWDMWIGQVNARLNFIEPMISKGILIECGKDSENISLYRLEKNQKANS
jgi:endogenous inhibitor of DNA gyrase (YacG/DUF329 family)